jgi:hypothetical protein
VVADRRELADLAGFDEARYELEVATGQLALEDRALARDVEHVSCECERVDLRRDLDVLHARAIDVQHILAGRDEDAVRGGVELERRRELDGDHFGRAAALGRVRDAHDPRAPIISANWLEPVHVAAADGDVHAVGEAAGDHGRRPRRRAGGERSYCR